MRRVNIDLYPYKLLDELKRYLSDKDYRNHSKLPKFIFLCGKDILSDWDKSNRKLIEVFFHKQRNDIFCIYAENLFDAVMNLDLLTFEEYLAELSDGIVLFIESFGTACELGAFSVKDSLMSKMLVFCDSQYRNSKSFINEGPLKKIVAKHSNNVVYVGLDAVFSNEQVYDKLKFFVRNKTYIINRDEKRLQLNSFVLEILELITILGPIESKDLLFIYKYLKGFKSFVFTSKSENKRLRIKVSNIERLLINSKLVKLVDGMLTINNKDYEFRNIAFEMTSVQFNKLRARFLSRKYRYKKGLTRCI